MTPAADTLHLVGVWRITMRDAATGLVVSAREYRNVACANGKAVLAAWLNGEGPAVTPYGAVGTSSATPASTDTQLGAEIARVALATSSRSANITTLDFFYNTSQGNGAWAEAGLFIGTGTSGAANSGNLLSHVAVSETKTSSITATLEFSIQVG